MTILEMERELIKTREKLAAEERSHDAEIRRIAAELGFPLGGVTIEQIIAKIRDYRADIRLIVTELGFGFPLRGVPLSQVIDRIHGMRTKLGDDF